MQMTGFCADGSIRNAAPHGAAFFFLTGWSLLSCFIFSLLLLASVDDTMAAENALATDPAIGTLHIVAVMVEFQPDDNPYTSGNGTFAAGSVPYLESPGTHIDPLPHDRGHFEAHLEFARRYFEYHSSEQLKVTYQVLPSVIRLPNKMEVYSPIGTNPDPAPLANLAQDTWSALDDVANLGIEAGPQDDVLYVIFHAGIGRDIQLSGTTLDKTPQDIPSVYLGTRAFREIFNDPTFTGFPVENGSRRISNTVILPRTNTRAGQSITGDTFLLPLSINGLLTAQIGSHLGLPDLFNTETGESGIGRFGLMDGAGIFSYNGLFPPQLSAWEKLQLGWAETEEITPGDAQEIELPAASPDQQISIKKVSLSDDEYYLIENRHRDPEGTGLTLTIRTPDGSVVEQTFTNSDSTFVFQESGFDDLLIPGVVIDAKPYDFSLPGGIVRDDDGPRTLNGGILIWHIDESVIRTRLADGKGVNDDPERRGVELMEADGAQDIGRPVRIGFSQNQVNGSPFDFWFDGNNARVITQTGSEIIFYENRFADDTKPSSRSYTGSPSFFELDSFSENLPVASFRVRSVQPFAGWVEREFRATLTQGTFTNRTDDPYKARFPTSIVSAASVVPGLMSELRNELAPVDETISGSNTGPNDTAESEMLAILPAGDSFYTYRLSDGQLTASTPEEGITLRQPLILESQGLMITGPAPGEDPNAASALYSYSLSDPGLDPVWTGEAAAGNGFISSDQPGRTLLDGTSYTINPTTQTVDPNGLPEPGTLSEKRGQEQLRITPDGRLQWLNAAGNSLAEISFPTFSYERLHAGWIDTRLEASSVAFLLTDRQLSVVRRTDNRLEVQELYKSSDLLGWPAFADISGDGEPDILFVDPHENQLIALHTSGAYIDNFPYQIPGVTLTGTPLIADLNGDGQMNILLTGTDESSTAIYIYDLNLRPMDGSPLLTGGAPLNLSERPIQPAIAGSRLLTLSPGGEFTVWNFPAMGTVLWGNRYGGQNNKVNGTLSEPGDKTPGMDILNIRETYNWPNPARNYTNMRFQLSGEGLLEILITTPSGIPVYEQSLQTSGRRPQEILIDTTEWASGGYLALIRGTVNGVTEQKLVKIAVIK